MFSQHGEEWIDDELRNVAIPADLITKLHAITSMDDSELDRALCDVAVPAGVLERLRSIGTLDEVDLDDELKHVLVPISVMDRLRRIPATVGRVGRRRIPRQLAIAASLLVAAGVGYVIAISSSWFDALNKRPNQGNAIANAPAPSLQNDAIKNADVGESNVNDESLASHPPLETSKPAEFQFGPPGVDRPELSSSGPTKIAVPSVTDSNANGEEAGSAHVVFGAPVADNASSIGSSVAGDGGPSGTASATSFPPLQSMPPPVWRGISPPRERGYDLMFQLKHGVHPLVSPAASPALAVSQVPLVTSTASFDQACQLAAERKLPPAYKIRTEEFLAAMDYRFALPDDRSVAIRTALGPAPWGTPGASLLQVAAQAGKARPDNRTESADKSELVASDATMKVTFNPDAVSMYRLMGHEATSVAGLMSTTVEANLRSGEAATGLFELSLKPDGGETIATVEIKWRNPATGAMQTTRQTVSRLQLSPSFYQAPLSLQMAALAAETAEVLRGSPFAPPNTHSLGNVAELAGQLNPRLRNRPSFAKLMTLVDQAQRSHVVAQ